MARIYLASSWRHPGQPAVVAHLRSAGHEVYDFRNPPNATGFAWSEIDPDWQSWTADEYVAALEHPRAVEGFRSDFEAMQWADVCVLLLPAGRSAHLELGWCAGAGKRTAILTRDGEEPELMAKMANLVTDDLDEIVAWMLDLAPLDERSGSALEAVELPGVYWSHPGTTQRCHLRQDEPGVYRVSAEAMHQMMRELGWSPASETSDTQ